MPTIKDSTIPAATTLNVLAHHKKEEADLKLFWKLESERVTSEDKTTTRYTSQLHHITTITMQRELPEIPKNYNVTENRTSKIISKLNRQGTRTTEIVQ